MENFAVKQINEYLVTYADDYSQLDIPFDTYNKLGVELVRFENTFDKDNCLVNVVKTYRAILITLGKYIAVNSSLISTVAELEKCKMESEILHDLEKLKRYLEQFTASTTVFGDIEVKNITAAIINPVYSKYNTIYGIPCDGVYDPEKLYLIESSLV